MAHQVISALSLGLPGTVGVGSRAAYSMRTHMCVQNKALLTLHDAVEASTVGDLSDSLHGWF